MTRAPVLLEAADSLAKASTPEPFSTSKTSNWVARAGGLPPYIQHIAHDLMEKRGKSESNAIQMAVGIVKRWARGGGNVDSGTRAAASKAVAEWEAKKAKSHAGKVAESSVPLVADEIALREAALQRIAVFEGMFGTDGLVTLLAEGALAEAASWAPTMKRTASSTDELDRHEVYDGGQHVGTIARRRGFRDEPVRHAAFAVNGQRLTDYSGAKSQQDAIDTVRKHLEEAPARVLKGPTAGKFLVANPSSYSGETSYKSYSSEPAARHAAGLPPAPTSPERNSKVEAVAETLRMDLQTVSGESIPPLRRVQEARRRDPFDLISEDFNPSEPRGFHGKWIGRGVTRRIEGRGRTGMVNTPVAKLAAGSPRPRVRSAPSAARYEGGAVRASAKARAAHAAKPQIDLKDLPGSVGRGSWSKGAEQTHKDLVAGKVKDTETAHRTGKDGAYSEERQQLHERIIENLLQGKGVHEGKARAVFTAGGPASGKSRMTESSAGPEIPHDVVHANPDVVREMLPEYQSLKAAGRKDASNLTHEEASHIAKAVTRIALARQHHLLVDTVGDSGPGKFAGKVKAAIEAGHTTSVHYATVPVAEALKRSEARAQKTGRHVPESFLREAHGEVSKRFPEIAAIKGAHVQVFDTSSSPRLISESKAGTDKVVIHNAGAHKAFLDKAKG